MSLTIFGNKLEQKTKGKPLWPTFRTAFLDEATSERLQLAIGSDPNTVFWCKGEYMNREGANGGCYGNIKKMRTMYSFEHRVWVLHTATGNRKPLYLIGWIGEYGNGSIMHLSWQYPHCTNYDEDSLARAMFEFYSVVADILYVDKDDDKDVAKFLKHGREIIRHS